MIDDRLTILHLPKRTDRLKHLLKQLSWNNVVDYNIFYGIDAIQQKIKSREAICKSHKLLVQEAKDRLRDNCIIAEDDLTFTHKDSWTYFLSQIPQDYDLFFGCIYQGTLDKDNRIIEGMSGTMTMYSIHHRFYDTFLSVPDSEHIDRYLGSQAEKYKFFVTPQICCYQSGGYSDNLKQNMWYDVYLEDKTLYNG